MPYTTEGALEYFQVQVASKLGQGRKIMQRAHRYLQVFDAMVSSGYVNLPILGIDFSAERFRRKTDSISHLSTLSTIQEKIAQRLGRFPVQTTMTLIERIYHYPDAS